jgi:hypothetical protein
MRFDSAILGFRRQLQALHLKERLNYANWLDDCRDCQIDRSERSNDRRKRDQNPEIIRRRRPSHSTARQRETTMMRSIHRSAIMIAH